MFRNEETTLAGQCPIDTYATPEISMIERRVELTEQTILCKIWLARYREITHSQFLGNNSGLFEMLFNRSTDSSPTGTEAFAEVPKLLQVARSELAIRYVKPISPPY